MHGLDSAVHWIVRTPRKLPLRQIPPPTHRTMGANDLHARVQPQKRNSVLPRANFGTCVEELEPHSDCLRATIVSAKFACETSQLFESHLNTPLPHAQRLCVPRSRQLTDGCVGSLRMNVACCQLLRVVCRARGVYAGVYFAWAVSRVSCML